MITKTKQWIGSNRIFVATLLIGLVVYLLISISKHIHFNSTGYDLVIFDQAVRHYSEFKAPASSFRGYENLLGDHFHPILALLAPLYWLFDTPIALLVAQALLIISAAVPVYLYASAKLGKRAATFIGVAFVFNPLLIRAIYFDFHEIAFAIPLLAWAIYLAEVGKLRVMYLPLVLLLLVKEDMSLVVAFFGIYLLAKRRFKHAAVLFALGVVWFFITTKVLIPYFAGGGSFNYWSYDALGPDLVSSVIRILTDPLLFLSLLVFPVVKLVTFIKTFGLFLGLSFLSPILLLAVPLVLERFLSSTQNYWQFNYHYGATLAPILSLAAVDGLTRLKDWLTISELWKDRLVYGATFAFAAIAVIIFIATPMNFIFSPENYRLTDTEKAGYTTLGKLPEKTYICTTNRIAPHLGQHELQLLGFDGKHITEEFRCDTIVISKSLDASPALSQTIQNALNNGFTKNYENGDWVIYTK